MPDTSHDFSLHVLLFGSLKDAVQSSTIDVALTGETTVQALLQAVQEQHPILAKYLPHVRVAVNFEYCDGLQKVNPGDEVAIIPPVAGG